MLRKQIITQKSQFSVAKGRARLCAQTPLSQCRAAPSRHGDPGALTRVQVLSPKAIPVENSVKTPRRQRPGTSSDCGDA